MDFNPSLDNFYAIDLSFAMRQIHIYLDSHVDILTKKFVFFTHNEEQKHWWGWAAINPWYHLVKILQA